jgi:pimeloyl-ACP methyl ester carboxylesterase
MGADTTFHPWPRYARRRPSAFTQPVLGAAWKTRPTYYIVGTEDRTIQPDLQRFLAKRMQAKVTEVASSHVPMLSQPRRVYEVICEAADAVQQSA